MRCYSLFLLLLVFVLRSYAQIDNKCVHFNASTSLEFESPLSSTAEKSTTYQLWFSMVEWNEGSTILSNKAKDILNFELQLGAESKRELRLQVGEKTYTYSNLPLQKMEWAQLTIIVSQLDATSCQLFVNGQLYQASTSLVTQNAKSNKMHGLVLGANFKGRMDEVRLWNIALNISDFSLKNTINIYHPNYQNLVAYIKADQLHNTQLVDDVNGRKSRTKNVKLERVADNSQFNYKLVSGYTTFGSLFTREVPKEAYLLTNDLIILAGNTTTDGQVGFGPSDESALKNTATYMKQYKGRSGVLSFNGTKTEFTFPNMGLDSADELCFEGWFYAHKQKDVAYLIRKAVNNKDLFAVTLNAEQTIAITIDGETVQSNLRLQENVWQYLSVSAKWNALSQQTDVWINVIDPKNNPISAKQAVNKALTAIHNADATCTLGQNLKGKMDDVAVWNTVRTEQFQADALEIKNATLGKTAPFENLARCKAYWQFDLPSNPGHDSFSWVHLVQTIRSAFDGYQGFKIRASFSGGSEKNWEEMITTDQSRKRFAKGVAKLLEGPLLDGVDLDFEWCYDAPCWDLYAKTIHEVRALLPAGKTFTITPHVVAYKLPQMAIKDIDFALFQNYGPSPDRFTLKDYTASLETFRKQGYPDHKIVLSTSTTTSKGISDTGSEKRPTAYKNLIAAKALTQNDQVSGLLDGYRYWINSVDQTRKRAKLVVDQNLAGIMFWDMGCDVPPTNEWSIIRAISAEISPNLGLKKID